MLQVAPVAARRVQAQRAELQVDCQPPAQSSTQLADKAHALAWTYRLLVLVNGAAVEAAALVTKTPPDTVEVRCTGRVVVHPAQDLMQ